MENCMPPFEEEYILSNIIIVEAFGGPWLFAFGDALGHGHHLQEVTSNEGRLKLGRGRMRTLTTIVDLVLDILYSK